MEPLGYPWILMDVYGGILQYKILDYNYAYKLVFEYLEAFYNTVRIHSHCGYVSPNEYEDRYYSRNIKKAC